MDLTLVTAPDPAAFDGWLTDAKAYLRVDGAADDDLIRDLIRTAVARLDGPRGRLGRALATQTWRVRFDENEVEIPLPLPPLRSITSITYTDPTGSPETMGTGDYVLDGTDPALLRPRRWWPRTSWSAPGILVTFQAGYGTASDVPAALKTGLLEYVAALYDNRGGLATIPPIASDMLDGFRTRAF